MAFLYNIHAQNVINLPSSISPGTIFKAYFMWPTILSFNSSRYSTFDFGEPWTFIWMLDCIWVEITALFSIKIFPYCFCKVNSRDNIYLYTYMVCNYIMCHWVGSKSRWPCQWGTPTVSHPHQPCSAAVAHAYDFFNGIISYLVSLLLMPLPPQHYCLFQRILPFHDVPKEGQLQFCHICLQHHISNKSIFFLSVFFTVHFSNPYIVIGNKRMPRLCPGHLS